MLVVDDDPDILEALCDVLESEGYRVLRARHGMEALARLEKEQPSVILLDLMMPVMDGASFAKALRSCGRENHRDIPIVVISADGNLQRALALGARAFLPKPFDIDDLLHRMQQLLRMPAMENSAAALGSA